MLRFITRSLLLLSFSLTVSAQVDRLFNLVNIDAQAEREVENDQLEVTMLVEAEGNKPEMIADEVNTTMQWALDLSRANKNIDVSTRSYQTYPEYSDRFIVGWRASQELYLRSVDIADLTRRVGDLQQKLHVNQMHFSPTKPTRIRIENELIGEAMVAFRQRAEIIREHMDNKNYRIVNIQVNTGQTGPVMYQDTRVSMAKMEAAAPAVEAGSSKLIVTVTGSIQFY